VHARVVDQHVDPRVVGVDLPAHAVDLGEQREVGQEDLGFCARRGLLDLRAQRVGSRLIARDQGQVGALAGQLQRGEPAQAAGGAGQDDHGWCLHGTASSNF
jgi:hypothetical protein